MPMMLEQEWNGLRNQILLMGGEAERAIDNAMRSLIERDSELAAEVLAADDRVDAHELAIDHTCLRLFALKVPTEHELRVVLTAVKLTPLLERIADQASNIARAALDLNDEPQLKPNIDLPHMSARVCTMLKDALDAYGAADAGAARAVIDADDEVDRLYDRIFHELLAYMATDQYAAGSAARLLMVAKHLERIGDYVTDIGEQIIFMAEAQVIKHPRLLSAALATA